MKIDDVEVNIGKSFSKVLAGETFYYVPSRTIWIKLDSPLFDENGDLYNAVALDDGIPSHFNNEDKVEVIPTKLVNA